MFSIKEIKQRLSFKEEKYKNLYLMVVQKFVFNDSKFLKQNIDTGIKLSK